MFEISYRYNRYNMEDIEEEQAFIVFRRLLFNSKSDTI
jgi:hypothetical protein